jgi:hypothetical protein
MIDYTGGLTLLLGHSHQCHLSIRLYDRASLQTSSTVQHKPATNQSCRPASMTSQQGECDDEAHTTIVYTNAR